MQRTRTWLLGASLLAAGLIWPIAACASAPADAMTVGGEVAPDIRGVDLDGVAFKLSDYKGKVVLLDFWGDW